MSVLRAACESLEAHINMADPLAKLLMVAFQEPGMDLAAMPGLLLSTFSDDQFMSYETIN